MLLNRMIRNEGKLPYEKNQIINYARQEISIQLIFSVLMRAHLSISFAIIRCKMLKTYKRGTLKEKWTIMTFQASSFFIFKLIQSSVLDQQKEKGSFSAWQFLSFAIEYIQPGQNI